MKWLVDATLTTADWLTEEQPAANARQPTLSSDDPLERIDNDLTQLWVYSWLPLPSRPDDMYARRPLIQALVQAQSQLPDDFRLVLIDAWRPRAFQVELRKYYDSGRADFSQFVADPLGADAPPHTTGGAIDLTLSWRGAPLALGSDFDEFSPRSAPGYFDDAPDPESRRIVRLRSLLASVLGGAGLVPFPTEWWHWSLGDSTWARAQGATEPVYRTIELPEGLIRST